MAARAAAPLALREGDRERLTAWTRASSMRAGLAQRARIVLLAADGVSNTLIAAKVGVSRPTVIDWRSRYESSGLAGLDDAARSGRPRTVDQEAIITATLLPPPRKLGVTHWSSRLLAEKLKIGNATVARAWRGYGIQPWRSETFKFSTDPELVAKVSDVVGLVLGATGERDRAVCGREVPDPSVGSHRADPAAAARAGRAPQPRLHATRHHHAVRGVGDRHRHCHRHPAAPPQR